MAEASDLIDLSAARVWTPQPFGPLTPAQEKDRQEFEQLMRDDQLRGPPTCFKDTL